MDVPQHVLRTLFRDTPFPLIQHHVDSYNVMLETRIPAFIKASNPHQLELPDKRYIRVYIGGRDATKLRWAAPVDEVGNAVLPHGCRLDNTTYTVSLYADLEVEYVFPTIPAVTRTFTDVLVGKIPLMLRSKLCYLTGIDGYTVGECRFELGGYFVIDGSEKVLLTQEGLGNNMFYSGKRTQLAALSSLSRAAEEEAELQTAEKPSFVDKIEYTAGVRSVSEDASRGPFSHFLVIPPETVDQALTRLAMITLPGFEKPVPVISIFRALGLTTDKDIYDITLVGVNEHDRLAYDQLFYQLILSHEKQLKESDLDVLVRYTRTHSRPELVRNLHDLLFPHVEGETDTGALYRRKAYQLGRLLKMAMDVALDLSKPSDRDHFKFKRMETSGDLCFKEFRRIFRDMSKGMLLELDKRVNQFERANYAGDKLVTVFQPENITFYWRNYRLLNEFLKSFKGSWGGKDGIAQELSRTSYAGVISHLRRTNLGMDRTSNKPEPRRYHGSQMGFMCPVDSPDGRNIGYIKSLALFARISTPISIEMVKGFLKGFVMPIADIHPSVWDPTWTPVFVNSDLIGACMRTEELHKHLVAIRRAQSVGMSLGWDRVFNVYTITCDGGRPIRPVYREGTTEEMIRSTKSWEEIASHLDYIDSLETEVTRISLTPFHPTWPSELHMLFNLSAMTGLIPFSDHNPGTRNAFAIAQLKTTCAWFHTNYLKRYDTIAAMAAMPQIPLTQTWVYREIMGAGGCMPHGENCLVAITTYGGYNQEDSVMINQTAMDRGMFQTLYFHSYDFEEDMLDSDTHTEFANVANNPLYKDSVKRKEGKSYDLLDSEGIIKVGSLVTEDTILVGMVAPSVDSEGKIKSYRDVSLTPKRAQHGRVDSVYRYSIYDDNSRVRLDDKAPKRGLKGVKIRIVEERFPVIGDKMGSRHSQKGTCGLVLPEEDMPFTARGVRPDVIFNPHALPTRMTIGHWMESSWSRLALKLGAFVDATPFTTSGRSETLKKIMLEQGFEPYGSETLYNGMTGEMMDADIFMGPTYYQRMKYMVEDKINARSTGPRKLLTHQPLEGRADEGGLRIGEMERDALISHGMAKFLHESLMDRSDAAAFQYDKESEQLDTSRTNLTMPYCAGLYTRELESLHIKVQLKTE